ncbi:hypothetical protein BACERE00185_05673 [Bacillus mobilis]|uniref:Uncharacterized protein n=1 Tax=Bacillus mobilis TaxID=2026190 RepID=A0A1Y6AU59_9BACI|nr:hypothetical protein BACERE00185_05673 [Bacillus mobilis]
MIKRLEEIEDIMKGLSVLQYYIKFSSNKLGLHDINKACDLSFVNYLMCYGILITKG